MTKRYVDVSDELAKELDKIDGDRIIEALEELVEEHKSRCRNGGAELAPYDSVKEIRNDESKSKARRKQLELIWQRRIGHRQRLSTDR
ncbi:MAG: hypothetical protein ABEI13_03695 [Candidatus Paceibacteria bacterium]